ncbi:MAG: hypothetical protein IJP72_03865, partial [Bacteroidales bacterium]|nr:hypothetical protein [Bacteroidales bacterium]
HTDLLDNGRIPDPFYGTNEESLQWLSYVPCTYTCEVWKDELPFKKNNDAFLVHFVFYCRHDGTDHFPTPHPVAAQLS